MPLPVTPLCALPAPAPALPYGDSALPHAAKQSAAQLTKTADARNVTVEI
jgi:hypothetical protein